MKSSPSFLKLSITLSKKPSAKYDCMVEYEEPSGNTNTGSQYHYSP